MSVSVLLFGGTGSVGSQILKNLYALDKVEKIIVVSRREMAVPEQYQEKNIVKIEVVDYDNLDASKEAIGKCDAAFCALGTTRAKSGAEGFYKVDHDYVVSAAKLSKDVGCKKFCLISSQSANENSGFLYIKTKGEAERDTKSLEFEHHIAARPAFLRNRNDFRLGEKVMDILLTPVRLLAPTKMTIDVGQVAKAAIFKTLGDGTGMEILENADLHRLAGEFDSAN